MKEILFFVAVLAIAIGGIIAIANVAASWKCYSKWGEAGEVKYSMMGGCKIKRNGVWLPTSAIRDVQ